MNYIKAYYNLSLAVVHKEDRAGYFQVLTDTCAKEDPSIFKDFMKGQYEKQLNADITEYRRMQEQKELKMRTGWGGEGRCCFKLHYLHKLINKLHEKNDVNPCAAVDESAALGVQQSPDNKIFMNI
jgi:hypothetical protein